jgi:hypothetical protein
VGLLIPEEENGLRILTKLRDEMGKDRISAVFEEVIPVGFLGDNSNSLLIYHHIIKLSTNVILVYGDSEILIGLIANLGQFLMKGKVNSRSDIGISRRYFMLD